MKPIIVAASFFVLTVGADLTLAAQSTPPGDCGAAQLVEESGKVSVTEDGKTTDIKVQSKKAKKPETDAATVTCRTVGDYTVCSNGKHGCVWSNRSGKLLGCGPGI